MKIISVDCNYVEKEFAASFLLVKGKAGFFVECNTTHAIPFLLKAAESEGLSPEQVEGLLITHVHLDHAGGAGAFLKAFPNAKLYAHPKAARHAVDPAKLIASATAVYGEETMQKWYGTIYPCDPERVIVLQDGDQISFQGEVMKTHHLRGHANHHLVMMEPSTKTLFSGDSFGVAYPQVMKRRGDVILASTSPTDFDGPAALEAVDWIVNEHPEQIGLTHFGMLPKEKIGPFAQILRDQLQFSMELMKQTVRENLELGQVQERLQGFIVQYFAARGIQLDQEDLGHLAVDLKVNAQGLHFAALHPPKTATV
jgi:glyoxylase-like metal-dependent hydrolase (beta-lactamase superfamily II)